MSHSNASSGASQLEDVKTYMTGFILSIILTVIPFWMVMTGAASPAVILGTILAVVQILVHRGVLPAHEYQFSMKAGI